MKNPSFLFIAMFYVLCGSCNSDDGNDQGKLVDIPDVQIVCDGLSPVDMSDAGIVLSGADCSETGLRNAIQQGGKILCDCGTSTINITSEIQITKDVILDGGNMTLDGGSSTRIFHKLPNPGGIDFTLQNIKLQNGRSDGGGASFFLRSGGLILARSYDNNMALGGNLTCINVTFENGRTASASENDVAGGAVYVFGVAEAIFSGCVFNHNQSSNGGAIGNLGSDLLIYNSVFANNQALGDNFLAGFGGAIYVDGVASGGLNDVYEVCGTIFINNGAVRSGGATASVVSDNKDILVSFDKCTFSQNRAGINGGDYVGGAIYHIEDENAGGAGSGEENFWLLNTTLTNNEARLQGGGLWIIIDGKGTIANCTFYQNKALKPMGSLGGAIAIANAGYGGNYLVVHSTFAENTTEFFSGASYVSSPNFVSFHQNIFYNNRGAQNYAGLGHQLNGDAGSYSANGNLNIYYPPTIPNGSADGLILIGSLTEDPLLLPPSPNGGPTFTMALQPGSPAIDAGNPLLAPPADQRGVMRDAQPDLGAYEFGH